MTVHFDVHGGVWSKDAEIIAQAGAERSLRCEECDIAVTLSDPFQRGAKMVWLDVRVWVDDGVPKARCTSHG